MARTYRRGGSHGETTGRDGYSTNKRWSRRDCESIRPCWDPKYDRSNDDDYITESADSTE